MKPRSIDASELSAAVRRGVRRVLEGKRRPGLKPGLFRRTWQWLRGLFGQSRGHRSASPMPDYRCPSSRPHFPDAVAFAVVSGGSEADVVQYLSKPLLATPSLLEMAEPAQPTEVFRFAARCLGPDCGNYKGQRCQLARRVVLHLPVVVDRLPACRIRSTCVWHRQEGGPACLRCPQIITDESNPSSLAFWLAQNPSDA